MHTRRRGPGTRTGTASGSGSSVPCPALRWSSIRTGPIRKTRRYCSTASTPTRSSRRRSRCSGQRCEMFERGSIPRRALRPALLGRSPNSSLLPATSGQASALLLGTAESYLGVVSAQRTRASTGLESWLRARSGVGRTLASQATPRALAFDDNRAQAPMNAACPPNRERLARNDDGRHRPGETVGTVSPILHRLENVVVPSLLVSVHGSARRWTLTPYGP